MRTKNFLGGIHKGSLHRALGIPQAKKIPLKKLEAAKKTGSARVRKEATLAINMRGWKKK